MTKQTYLILKLSTNTYFINLQIYNTYLLKLKQKIQVGMILQIAEVVPLFSILVCDPKFWTKRIGLLRRS